MAEEKPEKDRIKTWLLTMKDQTSDDIKEFVITGRTINSALSKSCKFMRDKNIHERYLIVSLVKLHTVDY
jgi:hypothetical protein